MASLYDLVDKLLMNENEVAIYEHIKANKNKVIFDIGCFQGKFTQRIINLDKKYNNSSIFFLFDANPKVPHYLEKLIKGNNNIKFYNLAFNDKIEKKIFHLNNFFEASGSSFQRIWRDDKKWHFSRRLLLIFINIFNFKKTNKYSEIEINTSTIDDFFEENKIKKIDLLKIDTEGHEEYILKGASKILKDKKVEIIYTEISDKKEIFASKKNRIVNYLKNFNYRMVKEYPIKSVSILSNLSSSDLLFVKDSNKNL